MCPRRFLKHIVGAEKAGAEVILISVWTTKMQNPMQQLQHYRNIIDNTPTRVKLLLHIEDLWFVNKQNTDDLIKLRPFSVGLTWNADNNLAGGANCDGTLKPLGRVVIEKLAASGIIIDLAHLNRPSFYAVATLLTSLNQKLLCTHTCIAEINPHPRNLTPHQVKTIVDSGGLIGITLVGDFLTAKKRATLCDIYSHIKYFTENFGEDNLAIGTDFFGTTHLPKGLTKYKHFKRLEKFLSDKILHTNAKRFLGSYE